MNGEKWEKMSGQEKFNFLSTGTLTVKRHSGLDPKSPVGDVKTIIAYRAEVDGVIISRMRDTQEEAAIEGLDNMKKWIEER